MQIRSCEAADIEQAALIFCQAYAAAPYNESWELADASAYLRRFREIDPEGCFVQNRTVRLAGQFFRFLTRGIRASSPVSRSYLLPSQAENKVWPGH